MAVIKKIIYTLLTIVILGGAVFLASYAGVEHRKMAFQAFNLTINNPQDQPMVTEKELSDTLMGMFGKVQGRDLNSVPVFEMEQFLNANPYVENSHVYTTLTGDMQAIVSTRTPLVRVMNSFDESWLIDTCGVIMPLTRQHPVRVIVASGNIDIRYDTLPGKVCHLEKGSLLRDIYEISRLISEDEFLDALIGQLYVNEYRELEIIPRLGNQVILLGKTEDIEAKLVKLRAFYLQVMKHTGWEEYKIINLTFDNQVVCSK